MTARPLQTWYRIVGTEVEWEGRRSWLVGNGGANRVRDDGRASPETADDVIVLPAALAAQTPEEPSALGGT